MTPLLLTSSAAHNLCLVLNHWKRTHMRDAFGLFRLFASGKSCSGATCSSSARRTGGNVITVQRAANLISSPMLLNTYQLQSTPLRTACTRRLEEDILITHYEEEINCATSNGKPVQTCCCLTDVNTVDSMQRVWRVEDVCFEDHPSSKVHSVSRILLWLHKKIQ